MQTYINIPDCNTNTIKYNREITPITSLQDKITRQTVWISWDILYICTDSLFIPQLWYERNSTVV
ncbi:hypothetical protein HMPREF1212_04235 [Parabacteroides sp. HGS0025]|nr:hypothetical protein HMPREF1212_04235 [Parabacteroides sp. HGS0025]